jgi:hypothetical protein
VRTLLVIALLLVGSLPVVIAEGPRDAYAEYGPTNAIDPLNACRRAAVAYEHDACFDFNTGESYVGVAIEESSPIATLGLRPMGTVHWLGIEAPYRTFCDEMIYAIPPGATGLMVTVETGVRDGWDCNRDIVLLGDFNVAVAGTIHARFI